MNALSWSVLRDGSLIPSPRMLPRIPSSAITRSAVLETFSSMAFHTGFPFLRFPICSEHSSFTELCDFVQELRHKSISFIVDGKGSVDLLEKPDPSTQTSIRSLYSSTSSTWLCLLSISCWWDPVIIQWFHFSFPHPLWPNWKEWHIVKQIAAFLGYSSFVSKKRIWYWMYGNKYDTDVTVWSPEGKLHQVCLHVDSWQKGEICVGGREAGKCVLRNPDE